MVVVVYGIKYVVKCWWCVGYFQIYIEIFGYFQFGYYVIKVFFGYVYCVGNVYFVCQFKMVFVDVGDYYVMCVDVFCYCCCYYVDWIGIGNQYVFFDQIEGECGVYCVVEWVEDRCQVIRDIVGDFKGVKGWDYQIFSKVVWVVDVYVDGVVVQMGVVCVVVMVVVVGDMFFVGDVVVNFKVVYFLINFYYFVDIFVIDYYWYWNGFL